MSKYEQICAAFILLNVHRRIWLCTTCAGIAAPTITMSGYVQAMIAHNRGAASGRQRIVSRGKSTVSRHRARKRALGSGAIRSRTSTSSGIVIATVNTAVARLRLRFLLSENGTCQGSGLCCRIVPSQGRNRMIISTGTLRIGRCSVHVGATRNTAVRRGIR